MSEKLKKILSGDPPTMADYRAGMAKLAEEFEARALRADDPPEVVLALGYATAALVDGMSKSRAFPAAFMNDMIATIWRAAQERYGTDGG